MYTKKEVAVQISKQGCTLGSYKGDVERSHPLFSVRKQYFFTLLLFQFNIFLQAIFLKISILNLLTLA
jgi:hypothetical protein